MSLTGRIASELGVRTLLKYICPPLFFIVYIHADSTLLSKLNVDIDGIAHLNNTVYSGNVHSLHPSGNIASKGSVINGKLEGKALEFYPSGNIKLKTHYFDGIENGNYTRYNEKGSITESGFMKLGMKNGKIILYNSHGSPRKFEFYQLDELTKIVEVSNGKEKIIYDKYSRN